MLGWFVHNRAAVAAAAKRAGLSAAGVRSLDDPHSVAWALLGGNAASPMPLGEVIARGILPAPKYTAMALRCGSSPVNRGRRAACQNQKTEHYRLAPRRIRLPEQIGPPWRRPGNRKHRCALAREHLRKYDDLAIAAKDKAPTNLSAAQREKLREFAYAQK